MTTARDSLFHPPQPSKIELQPDCVDIVLAPSYKGLSVDEVKTLEIALKQAGIKSRFHRYNGEGISRVGDNEYPQPGSPLYVIFFCKTDEDQLDDIVTPFTYDGPFPNFKKLASLIQRYTLEGACNFYGRILNAISQIEAKQNNNDACKVEFVWRLDDGEDVYSQCRERARGWFAQGKIKGKNYLIKENDWIAQLIPIFKDNKVALLPVPAAPQPSSDKTTDQMDDRSYKKR